MVSPRAGSTSATVPWWVGGYVCVHLSKCLRGPFGGARLCGVADARVQELLTTSGVVFVRDVFSSDAAAAMRDAVWRRIEGYTTACRDHPETWTSVRLPSFQPIKQRSVFRAFIASAALRSSLDAIFGPGSWHQSGRGVQVLFTFPNTDRWTLPHELWHIDSSFGPVAPTTTVKVFCCVDNVDVGGGGTLALAGSHRFADRYSVGLRVEQRAGNTAAWRRCLNTDSWTRELIRAGREPERTERMMTASHDGDGIELGIVEMTGEPGDVYITDIHTFHCVAPNASGRPRIMLGALFQRTATSSAVQT